jgi:2-(1,2-epoxy-1,2-dihydrophenyl)acetyl-CoA isomerase
MSKDNVLLLNKSDGMGTITLNRPDKLNAFNDELSYALQEALKDLEKDNSVKVIVIAGAGRGFCSGQDLQARLDNKNNQVSLGESIRRRYNPLILKLRNIEKPIIASINGVAAGAGASLAFACDFRIASTNATFIQSFSKVGLVPDSGSTFLLPRLIGLTKAFELMLLADKLSAKEALDLGILNMVVAPEQLAEETLALAKKLAIGPSLAFALTKRAVNSAIFNDIEELLEQEANLQEIAGHSEDFAEGVKAFIEKRQPIYKGK